MAFISYPKTGMTKAIKIKRLLNSYSWGQALKHGAIIKLHKIVTHFFIKLILDNMPFPLQCKLSLPEFLILVSKVY